MSVNSNYTKKLKESLYACITACQNVHEICLQSAEINDLLDLEARKRCVASAQECLEACNQTVASCSVYLDHATESDSIARCRSVVEHCNICIKMCRSIIEHCNQVNKKCFDVIKANINVFQDCIDACRLCAEHSDL